MDFNFALDFFSRLEKNNTREWFNSHRNEWEKVKEEFSDFTRLLIEGIAAFDPSVSLLEPKHCTFRLNRDVRFSSDKSPYKIHTGAYIAEGGKKSPKAGYYFHLHPTESFIGGGLWMPESSALARVREEIDYCGEEFTEIISSPGFKKYFTSVEGESLKTAPKGYPKDHPNIDLLRLKSFTVRCRVNNTEFANKDFYASSLLKFKAMKPFINFLNRAFEG